MLIKISITYSKYCSELSGPNWHGCNPSEEYGAITFRLPGHPFRARGGKKNATLGKLFMVRIFEEMHMLGYTFIASSKLSQTQTDHSTLLFKKVFNNLLQVIYIIYTQFFYITEYFQCQ